MDGNVDKDYKCARRSSPDDLLACNCSLPLLQCFLLEERVGERRFLAVLFYYFGW
jgi:hypothetical protein